MKTEREISRRLGRTGVTGTLSALLLLVSLVTAGPAQAASGRVVVAEGESIQAAIDAADPGTTIVIEGAHTENLWITKDNISLIGKNADASITMPALEDVAPSRCAPPEFAPVICFFPDTVEDPPNPGDYINGGLVAGLTINGGGDSVAMIFTNRAYIRRNTMNGQACNGAFIIFATKFDVENNTVSNSPFCDGIQVAASRRGLLTGNTSNNNAFAGISVQDSQFVTIRSNEVSGNCIGVVVFDQPDGGFVGPLGVPVFEEDQPSENITVRRNRANSNNGVCYPFGPEVPVGGTGILVSGQGITVIDNEANDNVVDQPTISAAGVLVTDSDGVSEADRVVVRGNEIMGNSSPDGPADLVIDADLDGLRILPNVCGVSIPDGFCSYGS